MGFVDTHVHLHFPEYDQDRAEVISRARQAGIEFFVNVGTDLESSRGAVRLAERDTAIFATAGIHPHDAKDADEKSLSEIESLAAHPKVVAIGEVGLDYFRDHSPREKQREVFRTFLRMHQKIKKPLVLHCRDAYNELAQILKDELTPPFQGVMHCFSSDTVTMRAFLDLGLYVSFAGPLTYKKNDALREACRACPLDRLLLETDAPFLAPQSMRGKRNESAYLLETAGLASELKGISLEKCGEATTASARALFHLC